jgi:Holliday junction resolvasome RuvABC endonuclease subunit
MGPIWGVDLGMRSWHAVRIDQVSHSTYSCVIKARKTEERAKVLAALSTELSIVVDGGDRVFIEEPPLAGARNIRTFLGLAQTSGALMARLMGPVELVPVGTWKKEVCGNGSLDKAGVAEWLGKAHPSYLEHCGSDQNLIDATCIALFGVLRGVAAEGGIRSTAEDR